MNRFLFILFCFLLTAQYSSAQTILLEDRKAEFPGGEAAMSMYISKHLKFPGAAKRAGVQGTVIVGFVVDTVGRVLNARLVKGIDVDCNREAVRVVNSMPNWTPAVKDGELANAVINLPVTFRNPKLKKLRKN